MKHGEIVEYYVFVCAINNTNKLDFKKKRPPAKKKKSAETFLTLITHIPIHAALWLVRLDGPYE